MPASLPSLEQERAAILAQMLQLGNFRSGSITPISGRCGKPNCHCHQPGQPGHGPNYRLTRKVNGKTISETFSSAAELQKPSVKSRPSIASANSAGNCWKSMRGSVSYARPKVR